MCFSFGCDSCCSQLSSDTHTHTPCFVMITSVAEMSSHEAAHKGFLFNDTWWWGMKSVRCGSRWTMFRSRGWLKVLVVNFVPFSSPFFFVFLLPFCQALREWLNTVKLPSVDTHTRVKGLRPVGDDHGGHEEWSWYHLSRLHGALQRDVSGLHAGKEACFSCN